MKSWKPPLILSLAALGIMAGNTWSALPEVCRIQGGNTKLIFGTGFEPGAVEVYAWSPSVGEEELIAALAGADPPATDALPAVPPQEARKLRVLEADPRGYTMAVEFRERYDANGFYDALAGEEVCWIANGDGFPNRTWCGRRSPGGSSRNGRSLVSGYASSGAICTPGIREEHTANWSGFWGSNLGHVVDGHVLRDGSGFFLWGYRNTFPTPVAFIDIIGSRLIGRGNIRLIGDLVFANTVRFSEVVDFRQRPSFHIQPYWLQNNDPQQVAGIDIGPARGEMDGVPQTAPFKDWNLVEGTNIYDGPLGVDISARARHTILKNNAIHVDGADVVDGSGKSVVE